MIIQAPSVSRNRVGPDLYLVHNYASNIYCAIMLYPLSSASKIIKHSLNDRTRTKGDELSDAYPGGPSAESWVQFMQCAESLKSFNAG